MKLRIRELTILRFIISQFFFNMTISLAHIRAPESLDESELEIVFFKFSSQKMKLVLLGLHEGILMRMFKFFYSWII